MPDPNIATRNRRNRRKGKDWERDCRDQPRKYGLDTEKVPDTGKKDEGDVVIRLPDGTRILLEAKNGEFRPSQFVTEAILEADHFAAARKLDRMNVTAFAIVKRRGKSWLDSYMLTTPREFFGITE